MKTSVITYTVLFALVITACSKKGEQQEKRLDHTEVKGQLLDASTLEPIANGTIKIYQAPCPAAFGAFGEFMETTTDDNGFYSMSFKHTASQCYDIVAYADHYFTNENKGPGTQYELARASGQMSISKGKANNVDIVLAPQAWLKIGIRNISKQYDRISINGVDPSGNHAVAFSGLDIDTHIVSLEKGNFKNQLPIFLYYQGKLEKQYVDAVHCIANDTTYFEIHY